MAAAVVLSLDNVWAFLGAVLPGAPEFAHRRLQLRAKAMLTCKGTHDSSLLRRMSAQAEVDSKYYDEHHESTPLMQEYDKAVDDLHRLRIPSFGIDWRDSKRIDWHDWYSESPRPRDAGSFWF
jgi:hypothetical protein